MPRFLVCSLLFTFSPLRGVNQIQFFVTLAGIDVVCRLSADFLSQSLGLELNNMANRKSENSKQVNENEENGVMPSLLVGYVRRSNAGGAIKLSINTNAFGDCETYTTADGQTYAPLVISLDAIRKVIEGDRAVTTVSQLIFD